MSSIWEALKGGGITMLALAILSTVLYRNLWTLWRVLRRNCKRRRNRTDELSREERVSQRSDFVSLVQRQLKHARALTVAAPLLGLLGTVIGMLDTFEVLGNRGQESITRSVADGISIALVTTQTGLIIAIPALFCIPWLSRYAKVQEFRLFREASPASSHD